MKFSKLQKGITLALSMSMLVACNGDSDSDNDIGSGDNSWVAGEFKAKEIFANKCAVVRTGSDPYTNEVYKDRAGTLTDEKMWLRSWNHESYLWFDEVEDVDPANYSTPQAYFEVLKTFAKTSSGADKDNFHFAQDTAEYRKRTQGSASSGYGIRWQARNLDAEGRFTLPRTLYVATIEPGSPADTAGFIRGDQIIKVDGADFLNGNDVETLNAGLFPTNNGQSHDITVKDVFGAERTITVTSGSYDLSPVKATNTFVHAGKTVGYIQFDTFNISDAQDELINKFTQFRNQNVSELVVDLRYNGGGLLALSSQLAYMIAGDVNTQNRDYYTLKYNGKWSNDETIGFYDKKIDWQNGNLTNIDLPTVGLNKVYVLSSDSTCSASEALINGLKGIDLDVVLIGGQTCGKPYGFVPTDNCSTTYFTIQFSGVNDKGFGEYSDGLIPKQNPNFQNEVRGCTVSDDLTRPLGDISEGMLSAALYHIERGSCPPIAASYAPKTSTTAKQVVGEPLKMPQDRTQQMIENNAIFTPLETTNK